MRIEFGFLYAHKEHHDADIFLKKKMTVAQLVRKHLTSMEPEGSLLCSQKFAIGAYSVLVESIPHPHIV
jgi:hypothetical protein